MSDDDGWEYDERGGRSTKTKDKPPAPIQTPGTTPTFVKIPDVTPTPVWRRTRVSDGFDEEALGWDPESTIGLFLTAIRAGSKRKLAAQYAGISYDRMKYYLGEGLKAWPDDEDDIPLGLLGRRNLTTEQIDTYIAMGRFDRAYRCPPAHGSGGGTGGITITAPEQLPEIQKRLDQAVIAIADEFGRQPAPQRRFLNMLITSTPF